MLRPISIRAAAALLVVAAVAVVFATADDSPRVISLEPSQWLGNDGNWSTFRLHVGQPSQEVNLIPSTALSEVWIVGTGGCGSDESYCSYRRGGVFSPSGSSTWSALGSWALGLGYLTVQANGDYGEDSLSIYDPYRSAAFSIPDVLVATINTTEYFLGTFGLGITSSMFGNTTVQSPLASAVSEYGLIPSYTYGYTAGAHYKNMPASMTLGGLDKSRFISQPTEFTLSTTELKPYALLRGIELVNGSDVSVLSTMDQSFDALIDTTTPFLWLPGSICDSFATALNLTYNETFDLYLTTDDQYSRFLRSAYSFTFSLSSIDNKDNFGAPLDVPGVVNLTVSSAAFALTLQYPFAYPAIPYGDAAIPYFPLRRLPEDGVPIIGRAFLQEVYLLTEFDRAVFSLHQAKFPNKPGDDALIVQVDQPDDSPLPGPKSLSSPAQSSGGGGQSISGVHIAAVVIGAVVLCLLVVVIFFNVRRLRRGRAEKAAERKDTVSSFDERQPQEKPITPVAKILTMIGVKRQARPARDRAGEAEMAERGGDRIEAPNHHEVYEMPDAAAAPIELDASNVMMVDIHDDVADFDAKHFSHCEETHRRLDIELQGPLPTYMPTSSSDLGVARGRPPMAEKGARDISPVVTHRPSDVPSPVLSPAGGNNSTPNLPSPLSPAHDRAYPAVSIPSPTYNAAAAATLPHSSPSSTHSDSSDRPPSFHFFPSTSGLPNSSPPQGGRFGEDGPAAAVLLRGTAQQQQQQQPPPPRLRTVISSSNIVCLGPLRNNVHLPASSQPHLDQLFSPDGLALHSGAETMGTAYDERRLSVDTLGSNFTEVEEELTRSQTVRCRQTSSGIQVCKTGLDTTPSACGGGSNGGTLLSPRSRERIETHSEMIHVPQPAERRYSWEEDR